MYSKIPGNEKIRKNNETGALPQRPGIYRLAANGMMDCRATAGFAPTSEQENDYAGGNEDVNGAGLSWEAIRAKLRQIIDAEDKSKPLNDEQIREKLAEFGIKKLARRTVAKYRKLLNIPAARFRKKY